ncbi:MAG: rod shape-determining protein MreC [Flavobacteriales bacterium]|nr:rod shape-determining protein MreC [Flavobacteriales bacterium]
MHSLLSFIWKNNFVLLFLLLELVSATLVVQNNRFHKASFINSANSLTGGVLQWQTNFSGYIGLREENVILTEQNKRLLSQSILAFTKYTKKDFVHNDTIYKQRYTYLNAEVINNSIFNRNNYLTLNKGYSQGIEPEMGVISSNGVVGIVKDVSEYFCTVLSVLHKNSRISSRIEGKNYFGSLIWDGEDFKYGTLKEIPSHVILQEEATVTTSGYSAIFPDGVPIGTIVNYEVMPGDNSYTIKIKFTEDYGSLSNVYVVANLFKKEQVELENRLDKK